MAKKRWDAAAAQWLSEKSEKADFRGDKQKLEWLESHFGGKLLHEIDRDLVKSVVELKNTPATRNRYKALIGSILRMSATVWKEDGKPWLASVPVLVCYKEPKRRIRYLKVEQVQKLVEGLKTLPPHQVGMFLLALNTGLRQGVVKRLEWDWVDLDERVIHLPEDVMKGDELNVPLNDVAHGILERWVGADEKHVFVYRGKPVRNVNTRAWQRIRRAAGLHNFRWHDATRHTWASWLAQAGTNIVELMELGGWKSEKMVRRYAALAPEHLRKHVAKLDSTLSGLGL